MVGEGVVDMEDMVAAVEAALETEVCVGRDRVLAVQVLMLGVQLRPLYVLSMDTASVLLTGQVGVSVVQGLVEGEHQILGQVMVVVEAIDGREVLYKLNIYLS